MTLGQAVIMADVLSAATLQPQYVVGNPEGDYWVQATRRPEPDGPPQYAYYTAVPYGYCERCEGIGTVNDEANGDLNWDDVFVYPQLTCPRCAGSGENAKPEPVPEPDPTPLRSLNEAEGWQSEVVENQSAPVVWHLGTMPEKP